MHMMKVPLSGGQLDDAEFEVYIAMRAWRLEQKRFLDIEAYKICQNRTLCELIRRRRNDPSFAANQASRDADLRQVWGLGPSKIEKFGDGMLDVLGRPELSEKLRLSVAAMSATCSFQDSSETDQDFKETPRTIMDFFIKR